MCLVILSTLSGCTTKEFKLGWYDKCLPTTVVAIKKVYPSIPDDRLQCMLIPVPGEMTRQSEVAEYLVDLTVAGRDCSSNLQYVRGNLEKFTAEVPVDE